jgi:signal transduction histidine kinase
MSKTLQFRVQSHVLKLLGDELIGHDRLAVFELVKNSYDADATIVDVTLDLGSRPQRIVVADNGVGMSAQTIENAWLEVGSDSKRGTSRRQRTPLGRMPLGEKGVGRLAVQKLGATIHVLTRARDEKECEFRIHWPTLIESSRYVEGAMPVELEEHSAAVHFKNTTGTIVEITDLHNQDWSRRDIRDLYRLVTSLSNPFEDSKSFVVKLSIPGREDVVSDLPSVWDMVESAVWKFIYKLDETGHITWEYEFRAPSFKGLKSRKTKGVERLALIEPDPEELRGSVEDRLLLNKDDLDGIGPISGVVYAFHKRDEILRASGAPQQIKKWLDAQTGVRVYRDKIRVFNYGEPGDDWLGLDARRINRPAGKLGSQSVIAQVCIDLPKSGALREKTNREGFDENPAFRRFRRVVVSIFDLLQREHAPDREAIDKALKGNEETPAIEIAMERLEKLGKRLKVEQEVRPIIQSIKGEIETFRNVMVSSGLAGMNLALVFHEIVHGIDRVQQSVSAGSPASTVRRELDHLRKLLDTFKPLLQRDPSRKVSVVELVDRALGMHEDRFRRHKIVVSNWTTDKEKKKDFSLSVPRGLLVAALSNVIDNAIYWSRFRHELESTSASPALLVLSSWDDSDGGMIAVVDNGPGVKLPAESIGKPFTSTRPEGMGLGLFYCKTVMEMIGGKFELISASQLRELIDIPRPYDGAAAVFYFSKRG